LDEVLAEIHEANHLQVPSIVHLPLYSPFLWPQQTMFDGWDAHPMPMGVSWSWVLCYCGCWSQTNVQDWSKSQPKSMRQTIYRSQPLCTYHFILHSFEPNKQCLMDEMPIQCPWESVGVGFLAIALADSKKNG
jgi:hypothetical protein